MTMNPFNMVNEFHVDVLKNPPPAFPITDIDPKIAQDTIAFLYEEIQEYVDAVIANDKGEAADALVDLIYFAMGALLQMGVDPHKAFQIVHHANMAKSRGVKEGREDIAHDASKPDDWTAPDLSVLFRQPKWLLSDS